MPQENLITQILREKREGKSEVKARIESFGIKNQPRDIHITAENTALRYRDTAMLEEALIRDHITKSNSYYTADFEWLLQEKLNAPFDLFAFTKYPTKLVYSGELKGVPIRITLEFPAVIGHCHYHVFWST